MHVLSNLAFKTNPLVLHSPGEIHPIFRDVKEFMLEWKRDWKLPKELEIYTINSPPHGRPGKPCGILEENLHFNDIFCHIMSGETYTADGKFSLHLNTLKDLKSEYVLFADSCDVVLLDSPEVILKKFLEQSAEVLFCPDLGLGLPQTPKYVEFLINNPDFENTGRMLSLNSGVFIGKRSTLITFMEYAANQLAQRESTWLNDQALMQRAWMDWYPVVSTDCRCSIIQNVHQYPASMRVARGISDHATHLVELIRKLPKTDRIFGAEIGVDSGRTSSHLLWEIPNLYLWMVDPWTIYEEPSDSSFAKLKQENFDERHQAALRFTEFAWNRRVICVNHSLKAGSYCGPNSLHWTFLDGSHTFPKVRQDLRIWWETIKTGGFLSGHDYAYQPTEGEPFGVKKAVHEFADSKNLTVQVSSVGDVWSIWKS